MSHTTAALCCTHPQERTDSPEPPSRPIANLDGIFATAALPEDHPHALTFQHRAPEVDGSIVRSPGFGSKIKLQFQRRRSKMSLDREKGYDGDARQLTSQEVLEDVGGAGETAAAAPPRLVLRGVGGLEPITSEDIRGLECLRPGVQRSLYDIAGPQESATSIVDQQPGINENERLLPPLPKSFSEPLMLLNKSLPALCPRRSRSESGLADAFQRSTSDKEQTTGLSHPAARILDSPRSTSSTSTITAIPKLHIRGPTSEGILESISVEEATELKQKASDDSALHLHKMGISQQLRCMSQLSDVAEDDITTASPHPWTFHHRERSDLDAATCLRRRPRHVSSSGMNSATMPISWGRVRSPGLSTASSVYSRPTSAGASADNYPSETPDIEPVPQVDLNALFADWPLKPSTAVPAREKSATGSQRSQFSVRPTKPSPSTPSRKDSGTASFVTTGSVKWLSPPQRARSPSESVFTNASKSSKFLERFSSPKRTVKKRRSIFKFLRPGSRKQQARSISTPVLYKTVGSYDGQSEDPALLTVQYELDERPSQAMRSVSMIDFAANTGEDTLGQLPGPHALQRRPTLADYERNLTVLGDDRRRPSAIDVTSAKEVQEDEHRNSVGLRRRLSRARPLKDDASPLMAQALEKHQQEKALFRSASKQRESLGSSRIAPVFKSSPFSSGVPTPDNHSELLDPRDKARVSTSPGRSLSSTHLAVPGASTSVSSENGRKARSARTNVPDNAPSGIPLSKKCIGTALESWSRYPSHNRADRCASAGQRDNVITRDFAVDIDHENIQETDEPEANKGVDPKTKWSKTKHPKALPKSRSMTFSSIMRYYSNIFSSTSVGQNRRTSVSTGGKLEYPELELLPPQLAAEPIIHAHHQHSGALTRLKEHAKEDAEKLREFVQEEEDKVEDFVREEEDRFETFVKREEDLVEGFVKKEEGKLKDYVRAEEDKFKHHHWHHHSSEHESTGRESPFREISLFEVPRDRSQDSAKRRNTIAIGPNDDEVDEGPASGGSITGTDAGLKFDGAASAGTENETKHASVSKADMWSDVYRQCLVRPSLSAGGDQQICNLTKNNRPTSMPPPLLKPTKARSPEQPRLMEPQATIRRFPSVTVVDDRKGHFRSISLISVKTSRSTGFERSSTHDLLELVQAREHEEREKLLKPVQSIEEAKEVAAF